MERQQSGCASATRLGGIAALVVGIFATATALAQDRGVPMADMLDNTIDRIEIDLSAVVVDDARRAIATDVERAVRALADDGRFADADLAGVISPAIEDYLRIQLDPQFPSAMSIGALIRNRLGEPLAGAPRLRRFARLTLETSLPIDSVEFDGDPHQVRAEYVVLVGTLTFDGFDGGDSQCPQIIEVRLGHPNIVVCE